MVARMQRTTVFLLWAVALLWFGTQAWDGHWLSAAVGALLLLNLQQLALAFEFFVLLPLVNRGDPAPKPSWGQLLRAWWRESLTAHSVFGWQQPFRSQRHADTIDGAAAGQRVVVLVHGFFCNRGIWNSWAPRLREAGVPHIALSMEPPFGAIEGCVAQIDAAIERATRVTGLPPLLVCHSMGGLAARAWWRAHRNNGAAARVHGVITIGSPHHGTFTARLARADNARQMRPASEWLQALAAGEDAAQRRRFTCFYSHCDNIVMPASTAVLPGADNRHIEGVPHVALVYAPEVWDEVMRRLGIRNA